MRRRFLGKIKTKNNVLYYTSTDNLIIDPYRYNFGTIMINNEMSNNIGVMTFLADITTIGDYAFHNCDRFKSITIPDSVTTIGYSAFNGCSSLTSITIPDGVTEIGGYAFSKCYSLTSVTIPDGVTSISRVTFYGCNSLKSITIPDSVTTIGNGAFEDCENLTSVTIGNSVTTIAERVFRSCHSLTSVYCKAITPPSLGDPQVFDYNGSGRKIYVPYQSLDAYKTATYWSEYADDIVGYDFENDKVIITFTVNDVEYQAEEGMTWEEWCNSEYNVDRFRSYLHTAVFTYDGGAIVQGQTPSDVICNGCEYITISAT